MSTIQTQIQTQIDQNALRRDYWINKNRYYYKDLKSLLQYTIPKGARVLEIGTGTGDLLNAISPSYGVGVDISSQMISAAKSKYPHLHFVCTAAEKLNINANTEEEKFDYIIISDTLAYLTDIQQTLQQLKRLAKSSGDTRVIFTFHNFFWGPILKAAEWLGLKMPQERLNWLNQNDLLNFLYLEGFDLIKSGQRFLCPKYIPFLSNFCNKYLVQLPFFRRLSIYSYVVARINSNSNNHNNHNNHNYSVSVIIPARNEKGNIEDAVKRVPLMGKHTEIIFVEGNSTDDTLAEIKRICEKYKDYKDHKDKIDLKYFVQDGKGKGDAVRKGFEKATGDILMILDADLTVPPEELPKFYHAIASGKGEFINGSRLVYPLEKDSMRMLNILGNKFFSMCFTWLLSQNLKDTLCGTKVIFNRHYLQLIKNRSYFGEFDPFGDFDLIFGAAKLNLKIVEIPIRYKARTYGETNISRFYHGLLLLKMVIFAMNKIKFISTHPHIANK
ncbi:MAG: glycosyltransferase [Oligoflexia bacterium]|nr:glycosyltransferase [Oligoflexia bacterium]